MQKNEISVVKDATDQQDNRHREQKKEASLLLWPKHCSTVCTAVFYLYSDVCWIHLWKDIMFYGLGNCISVSWSWSCRWACWFLRETFWFCWSTCVEESDLRNKGFLAVTFSTQGRRCSQDHTCCFSLTIESTWLYWAMTSSFYWAMVWGHSSHCGNDVCIHVSLGLHGLAWSVQWYRCCSYLLRWLES